MIRMGAKMGNSVIVFLGVIALLISGSSVQSEVRGSITGSVYDMDLKVPIEYATVILYQLPDSSQVTGTITGKDGRFIITGVRPGEYYLEVSFIGYQVKRLENIQVASNGRVNLGDIYIRQTAVPVEEVRIFGTRPKLTYQIDRKVLNVAQRGIPPTGTAVDVLKDAPSVKVDAERNITLRGSSNFTVLIDSRPTLLEPKEALEQIPAVNIDRIEIITNPSAKYEAEGVTGIINVILKKQRQPGSSGLINASGGLPASYNGTLYLNYRQGIFSGYLGARAGRTRLTRRDVEQREIYSGDTTFYFVSKSLFPRVFFLLGVNGGFSMEFSPRDKTSFDVGIGRMDTEGRWDTEVSEWSSLSPDTGYYNSARRLRRPGPYHLFGFEQEHRLGKPGHKVLLRADYCRRYDDYLSRTERLDSNNRRTSGWQASQTGRLSLTRVQVDYTLPFTEQNQLEAGLGSRFDDALNGDTVSVLDTATGEYEILSQFSRQSHYNLNTNWAYSTFSGTWGNFGTKIGLRTEFWLQTVAVADNDTYRLKRLDFFPTLHLSYQLPRGQQMMASYARRINRPTARNLRPYLIWTDPNTRTEGNPELKPEFVHSFDFGYLLPIGGNRLSAEIYYRITQNAIDHIRSVDSENIIVSIPRNVGSSSALGGEFTFDFSPLRWWTVSLTGEIYDYQIKRGDFPKRGFIWSGSIDNQFQLPTNTQGRFLVSYDSPKVDAQGT